MEGVNAKHQQVLLLTMGEINQRIRQALYTSDVGCPETVYYELSQATHDPIYRERILKAAWRCLNSHVSRYKRIKKALCLLTYLALNGHEACITEIINHIDDITALHDLEYPAHGMETASIIKDKAIDLINLVCNPPILERRRREVASLRSRFIGVTAHNGRVETQAIHKPIYTVDPKNDLLWVLPQIASQKWAAFSNLVKNTGLNISKKYNSLVCKKGANGRTNSSDMYPVLRTMGDHTAVGYRGSSMHEPNSPYSRTLGNPEYSYRARMYRRSVSSSMDEGSVTSSSDSFARHLPPHNSSRRKSIDTLSGSSGSSSATSWEQPQDHRVRHGSDNPSSRRLQHTKRSGYRNDLLSPHYKRPVSMDHIEVYGANYDDCSIVNGHGYRVEHSKTLGDEMKALSLGPSGNSLDGYARPGRNYRIDDKATYRYDSPEMSRGIDSYKHFPRY
ncbi:ENTH (epsin) domain family protein [Babesia bovis T2Bo]|uniref:ENTH domain-containing protein n=1 Tax=Babesia bovis TaxID=5865 RepID=A7AWE1_BABBO|nr:ENTH (epsin) domain family protein [Babesia bovis T2Bo]EDO05369.1 ENTH (epsin) domain family protein [Babesia bovis T2Bo]|eukprot:XP_001608937.1 hypothetical protein [Babesia bovis T2Bo]